MFKSSRITTAIVAILVAFFIINPVAARTPKFQLEEASVADINKAFDTGVLTAEKLVQLYLERIAAYVDDPTYVPSERPNPATVAGYNSVGFPDITVPMGFGSTGLPMTISFLGRPYSEGKLIGFAYDYEQATRLRRPSLLLPPLLGEKLK